MQPFLLNSRFLVLFLLSIMILMPLASAFTKDYPIQYQGGSIQGFSEKSNSNPENNFAPNSSSNNTLSFLSQSLSGLANNAASNPLPAAAGIAALSAALAGSVLYRKKEPATKIEYVTQQVEEEYEYPVEVKKTVKETVMEKFTEAYTVTKQVPRKVVEYVTETVPVVKQVPRTIFEWATNLVTEVVYKTVSVIRQAARTVWYAITSWIPQWMRSWFGWFARWIPVTRHEPRTEYYSYTDYETKAVYTTKEVRKQIPKTIWETVTEYVPQTRRVERTVYDEVTETAYREVWKPVEKEKVVTTAEMRKGTKLVDKKVPVTKEDDSIGQDTIDFFSGMGTAVKNNAIGLWDMASGVTQWILKQKVDPAGAYTDAGKTLIDVFSGLGYVITNPEKIIKEIKDYADKNPHNKGEVLGEVLLAVLPLPTKFLKITKLKELTALAKAGKIDELIELRKAGRLSEEAAKLVKGVGGEERLVALAQKYGDEFVTIMEKYGDDAARIVEKYWEDGVEAIKSFEKAGLGKNNVKAMKGLSEAKTLKELDQIISRLTQKEKFGLFDIMEKHGIGKIDNDALTKKASSLAKEGRAPKDWINRPPKRPDLTYSDGMLNIEKKKIEKKLGETQLRESFTFQLDPDKAATIGKNGDIIPIPKEAKNILQIDGSGVIKGLGDEQIVAIIKEELGSKTFIDEVIIKTKDSIISVKR